MFSGITALLIHLLQIKSIQVPKEWHCLLCCLLIHILLKKKNFSIKKSYVILNINQFIQFLQI